MSGRRARTTRKAWRATADTTISVTGVYSWGSQASQFVAGGEPGLEHRVEYVDNRPIDCLLMRDERGGLVGILYHYPVDMPHGIERAGNVNMWVRPDRQRQGIGSGLLAEARKRWRVDATGQRYSTAGAAFVNRMLDGRGRSKMTEIEQTCSTCGGRGVTATGIVCPTCRNVDERTHWYGDGCPEHEVDPNA